MVKKGESFLSYEAIYRGGERHKSVHYKVTTDDNLRRRVIEEMAKNNYNKATIWFYSPDYNTKPVFIDTFEWAVVEAKKRSGATSYYWTPTYFRDDPSGRIDPKTGSLVRPTRKTATSVKKTIKRKR